MNDKIEEIINESITVKSRIAKDPKLIAVVGAVVTLIVDRFRGGNTYISVATAGVPRMHSTWQPSSRAGSLSTGTPCHRRPCTVILLI
jgi:hypothetical protein